MLWKIKKCLSPHQNLFLTTTTESDTLPSKASTSKRISAVLRKRHSQRPSSEQFFIDNFDVEQENWKNIYILPFFVTIESKLRTFQFKINHNIYFTNEKLNKAKMKSVSDDGKEIEIQPQCTFCKKEIETLEHLFVTCEVIEPLWDTLERLIGYSFSPAQKLLGCYNEIGNRPFDIISHLTILLKHYIHICRLKKCKPLFTVFSKKVVTTESIEFRIAAKLGKATQHAAKWGNMVTKFSF